MIMNFRILIGRQKDGTFTGECASLHGCTAEGKTVEELLENMNELIREQLKNKKENTEPSYSKEILEKQFGYKKTKNIENQKKALIKKELK